MKRTLAGALVACALATPAVHAQTFMRIENRFRPGVFLHTERGPVSAGPIQSGWWSADWILEPVADAPGFVKIRNRFRPLDYIHTEQGPPTSGPIQPGWWSAQWAIEPVPGTPFARIRNRFRPTTYLHMEHGTLEAGPIDQGWWSAQWAVNQRIDEPPAAPVSVKSAAPTPAPPPPAPAGVRPLVATWPDAGATPTAVPMESIDERCNADGRCIDMSDPTIWRIMRPGGPIPTDAYVVGSEPVAGGARRNLYVCVAYLTTTGRQFDNRRFIGKTGPGFQGCNVAFNGREVVMTTSFEILVGPLPPAMGNLLAAEWVGASGGIIPAPPIQTFGGDALCRGPYQGGVHPGRVLPGRGCAIGYAQREIVLPSYEVLVRPGGQ